MDPGGFYERLLKRFHVCPPNSTEVICEGYNPPTPHPPIGMSSQDDIISYKVSTLKQCENS